MTIPTNSDVPMHGWYPYHLIHHERIAAHKKHDDNGDSMERKEWNDPAWLPVLVEEVGEVAHVLTEIRHINPAESLANLRSELIQVAAMATAWIESVDRENYKRLHPELQDVKR